jgi:hypothetical protein
MTNILKQQNIQVNNCRCEKFFHQKLKLFDYTKQEKVHSTNQSINYDNKLPCMPKYFNIGYVLLIISLGGINFDSLKEVFDYTYLDRDICCLLHLLIDIESTVGGKFKITNFLSSYSNDMIDFLCHMVSFKGNNDISNLKNHIWFRSHPRTKVRLSLKEIIKVTRDNKLPSGQENRLQMFINNYEIIRSNNKEVGYDVRDKLCANKSVVKDLCKEIGVSVMEFSQKLQNIVI